MGELANSRQVDGNHYRGVKYQHWDLVAESGMGYFEGQITKYVSRWRLKNGTRDLEKALHYCDKLLELFEQNRAKPALIWHIPKRFDEFADRYQLNKTERHIHFLAMTWRSAYDLRRMQEEIISLIGNVNS